MTFKTHTHLRVLESKTFSLPVLNFFLDSKIEDGEGVRKGNPANKCYTKRHQKSGNNKLVFQSRLDFLNSFDLKKVSGKQGGEQTNKDAH